MLTTRVSFSKLKCCGAITFAKNRLPIDVPQWWPQQVQRDYIVQQHITQHFSSVQHFLVTYLIIQIVGLGRSEIVRGYKHKNHLGAHVWGASFQQSGRGFENSPKNEHPRVCCKRVYPTLKVNIQHFFQQKSSKI